MAYSLHPSRGFLIEKMQPPTRQDVGLIKTILDKHEEVVIGIGSAGYSHEPQEVMTAGERIEVLDTTLQSEGIDPGRYIIVPVENMPEATSWVAQVMMMTPRWDTFYTRNFKNASMFATFQRQHNYQIETVDEQKPQGDNYGLISHAQVNASAGHSLEKVLNKHFFQSTICAMERLGIIDRISTIYNRKAPAKSAPYHPNRALFLGGFQPFTGVYGEQNGHLSNVLLGLSKKKQVVIAVGSAQASHQESDPLTAGKRLESIRYTLLSNGIQPSQFYTIPIQDVPANAAYSTKVVSLCPQFDAVIAGNDWTKQLFGEGRYEILEVSRTPISGSNTPLSATRARTLVMETIRSHHKKDEPLTGSTLQAIRESLAPLLDKHALNILQEVGFFETLRFLAYAKE